MKILVTGAAGYIGSHVCKLLRTKNVAHLAFDNFSTGSALYLMQSPFIKGDIADISVLESVFDDFKPDVVIHLAALSTISACENDPNHAYAVNVIGTRNLLDTMVKSNVRHIVFASSSAVYAPAKTLAPFTEQAPLGPINYYGKTKLMAEQLLEKYRQDHALTYTSLRLFNVAGADPDGVLGEDRPMETHLLPLALSAALNTSSALRIYGNDYETVDGTAIRDYIHVWDVVQAIYRGALHGITGTFNIASGVPTTVLQMIRMIEKVTGKSVPHEFAPRRVGDVDCLVANNASSKALLGNSYHYESLEKIIASCARWQEARYLRQAS